MKKYILKQKENEDLVAELIFNIDEAYTKEIVKVISNWIEDITFGQLLGRYSEENDGIFILSRVETPTFRVLQKRNTLKVYKRNTPSFYIEEIK